MSDERRVDVAELAGLVDLFHCDLCGANGLGPAFSDFESFHANGCQGEMRVRPTKETV